MRPVTMLFSDLFQGDTKRLEPHLGLDFTSQGCVKLDFKGPELLIKLDVMVIHKSKLENVPVEIRLPEPGEFTFAFKEEYLKDQLMYCFRVYTASSGFTNHVETHVRPENSYVPKLTTRLANGTQVELVDGTSVELWRLVAGEPRSKNMPLPNMSLPFDELVKHYEWGVILNLSVV